MKFDIMIELVAVAMLVLFGLTPQHAATTVSPTCTRSQTPGNLTIDNHMKLESATGVGPIIIIQPRTIIPFPNISFYSSCSLVQIDIIADGLGSLCSPNLAILEEFPGKKYQTASKRIPPSKYTADMASWTGVHLDDYMMSVTAAYTIGMSLGPNCQLKTKAKPMEVTWFLLDGSAPDFLQTYSDLDALEPFVMMTIRASDACNRAACGNCQTLYQSCPALGATGESQYQYYC
eukprot:scpid98152/ scgid5907/ 